MRYRPVQIDTKSASYARMTKAGFFFEIDWDGEPFSGYMRCVCGKKEYFYFSPKIAKNNKIDVARLAEESGAASIVHLKDDGYSREEILRIRMAFI